MSDINDVLVPPRRLGALLRESRVAAGEDLGDVASRSERLTVGDLDDLEHGRRTLDDALLREVVDMYGVEVTELLPGRSSLTIDLDEGLISVGASHVMLDAEPGPDVVLVRYLALVHRLRGLPVGTPLQIRDLDIGVLATALELDDDEIERRLQEFMAECEPVKATERDLRRRLLVPLAGVVVASTAVGVLVLVNEDATDIGTPDPGRVMVQIDVDTDIGDAVVVERGGQQQTRD